MNDHPHTSAATPSCDPAQPSIRSASRLRICLAASGGGHIRQLLDLKPAWLGHNVFFVTEDTALSRTLAERYHVRWVDHVALGQGRLGAPLRMAAAAFRNFFQSALIVLRERPQIVISTGAGSVFFTVLWSRLIGAKVVVIESFARFEGLSAFARLARPLAHQGVVQSKGLARLWPEAAVFDPMRMIPPPTQEKAPMVFVTVGATLPFDRLVKGVADLKAIGDIPETVRIQTGIGGYRAAGIETAETLPFDEVLSVLEVADIVVCHGGTGSLITALRQGCRVVAMPRSFEMGEHYDNHQLEIIDAFAARGLISVAKSVEDLGPALRAARAKPRVAATSEPRELNDFLKHLLAQWSR